MIFVTTDWESDFPLARVKSLDRQPSDHNPLMLDTGDNGYFGKQIFCFEKWWLQKESFVKIAKKAWSTPCKVSNSMEVWQFGIRTL